MVIVISSPRYEKDFISAKFKEVMEYPDVIFSLNLPTWMMKDREKMSREVFIFDLTTYECYKQ